MALRLCWSPSVQCTQQQHRQQTALAAATPHCCCAPSWGARDLRPTTWGGPSTRAKSQLAWALPHSHHNQGPCSGHHCEDCTSAALTASEATTQPGQQQQRAGPRPHHQAFASLTRVLLVGQPSVIVRNLATRKWRGAAGPISLLLFLFGLVLAILTAIRTVLVKRVKSCSCCRGYGIVRCRLCNGEGSVEWRGKNTHQETCPLCMTKRFVACPDCGGHYHRKMFIHIKPATRAGVPDFLQA